MQKFFLEPVFDNKEVFFVFIKVISPFLLTNEATGFCVLNYIFKIKVSSNKKELLIEYGTNENLLQVEFNCEKKTEFYIGRKQDADILLSDSQVKQQMKQQKVHTNQYYQR